MATGQQAFAGTAETKQELEDRLLSQSPELIRQLRRIEAIVSTGPMPAARIEKRGYMFSLPNETMRSPLWRLIWIWLNTKTQILVSLRLLCPLAFVLGRNSAVYDGIPRVIRTASSTARSSAGLKDPILAPSRDLSSDLI